MKGLVAFSFALGREEPNPCNVRLAREVERLSQQEHDRLVIVAQWEVAKALTTGRELHIVERHRQPGVYLDSDEVMAQAAEVFHRYGILGVIPVANPFLHLFKCRGLVRSLGFIPLKRKIGNIGFYPDSLQWWTRGPCRAVLYSTLVVTTGRRGK